MSAPKKNGAVKKIQRLKRKNGVQRKTAGFAAFGYQKKWLKAQARKKGMTMSYYVNMVLWSEWL
jgi:hypothetical protein